MYNFACVNFGYQNDSKSTDKEREKKFEKLKTFIVEEKVDIFCINKYKKKYYDNYTSMFEKKMIDYKIYINPYHMIGIKKDLLINEEIIEVVVDTPEQFCISLKIDEVNFLISSIRIRTEEYPNLTGAKKRGIILRDNVEILKNNSANKFVLAGGDLNSYPEFINEKFEEIPNIDRTYCQTYYNPIIINSIVQENGLKLLTPENDYSFKATSARYGRYEHFITNINNTTVKYIDIREEKIFDHKSIICTFDIKKTLNKES